jgi:hypothetical protein
MKRCANCPGHCPQENHYSELVSTGDVTRSVERKYFACLTLNCPCKRFEAETGDKKRGG